ncbi:hypothetical protein QQZ08_004602 [Neonectria magnoliae]|uniref:Uncharacterized protein n=1 Tax=Neonectria magnoliae TaxID=2732573 RepID=A0ABR1I5K0_9HYPO
MAPRLHRRVNARGSPCPGDKEAASGKALSQDAQRDADGDKTVAYHNFVNNLVKEDPPLGAPLLSYIHRQLEPMPPSDRVDLFSEIVHGQPLLSETAAEAKRLQKQAERKLTNWPESNRKRLLQHTRLLDEEWGNGG